VHAPHPPSPHPSFVPVSRNPVCYMCTRARRKREEKRRGEWRKRFTLRKRVVSTNKTKQKLKRENKPRKNSNNVVSPMPSLSACRFPFTYTHGVEENFFSFVSSLLSSSSTSFPPRFIIFLTSDVRSRRKVVTPTQVIRLGFCTFFFFVLRTTKTDLPQSLFLYSVTHSESTHPSAYIKLEKKVRFAVVTTSLSRVTLLEALLLSLVLDISRELKRIVTSDKFERALVRRKTHEHRANNQNASSHDGDETSL